MVQAYDSLWKTLLRSMFKVHFIREIPAWCWYIAFFWLLILSQRSWCFKLSSLDDLPSKVGLYNHSFDTALLSLETKQLTRENEYSSFLQEVIESWGDLKRLLILISRATFAVTFAVRIIFCLIYTVETIKDFELCLLDQYYFSLLV